MPTAVFDPCIYDHIPENAAKQTTLSPISTQQALVRPNLALRQQQAEPQLKQRAPPDGSCKDEKKVVSCPAIPTPRQLQKLQSGSISDFHCTNQLVQLAACHTISNLSPLDTTQC